MTEDRAEYKIYVQAGRGQMQGKAGGAAGAQQCTRCVERPEDHLWI